MLVTQDFSAPHSSLLRLKEADHCESSGRNDGWGVFEVEMNGWGVFEVGMVVGGCLRSK
jgi:hypothetical protein